MPSKSTAAVKKRTKKSKDASKKEATEGQKTKKKRSKVSEESKARQEEQRAAIEEERRRLREELVGSFLRHKLSREEEMVHFNRARFLIKWRETMRGSKNQELLRTLADIKADFEDRLQRNQRKINDLFDAIRENELNQKSVCEKHQSAASEALVIHLQRLKLAEEKHVEERKLLQEEISKDCDKFNFEETETISRILDNIRKSQAHFSDCFQKRLQEYLDYRDDIINKGLEETQSVRLTLERVLEDKWKEMHRAAPEGGLDHQRWSLYSGLVKKDTAYNVEHLRDRQKIDMLSVQLAENTANLRKLEISTPEEVGAFQQFLDESRSLQKKYRKMLRDEENLHTGMKVLSTESRDTVEFLEGCLKTTSAVLRLAQRCDFTVPPNDHHLGKVSSRVAICRNQQLYEEMQNFWSTFNATLLECLALKRYKSAKCSLRGVDTTMNNLQVNGVKQVTI